jgi:uncharacterized protein (UPF0332 family)
VNEWKKISGDKLRSAEKLRDSGYLRSALSRAYYAAYSAVTMHLVADNYVPPSSDRERPGHAESQSLVLRLPSLSKNDAKDVREKVSRLYKFRLEADYRAKVQISRRQADQAIMICRSVLGKLGMRWRR